MASASASASNIWPRPGLDLVVLLCNRVFFGQNRVKFGNCVNFSGNNLKSHVVNHHLVLFWPRPWLQLPEIGLGLGLVALASASRFWPRLTPLRFFKTLLLQPGKFLHTRIVPSVARLTSAFFHVYYIIKSLRSKWKIFNYKVGSCLFTTAMPCLIGSRSTRNNGGGGGAQKFEGPHVCKWIWQVMATRKILRVGCKGLKHGTAFHRAMLSLRIACHKLCFSVFVRSSRPGVVSKRLKVSKILTSSGSQLHHSVSSLLKTKPFFEIFTRRWRKVRYKKIRKSTKIAKTVQDRNTVTILTTHSSVLYWLKCSPMTSLCLPHDIVLFYYPRDAMLARVFATVTCPSVRPSVRHAPVLCENEQESCAIAKMTARCALYK